MKDETYASVAGFFSKYPHLVEQIIADPNNVEIWECFFRDYFDDWPVDVEITKPPLMRRKGSTDPRWDVLLHERQALRTMTQFIADYKLQKPVNTPLQEAA